jgi:hypothetical protein
MIHSEMPVKDQIKAVEEYLSDNKKIVLIYMTPDLVFCEHFKVSQYNFSFAQAF